ncbi:MAG: HD domain-containing protein [Treponema sp.]|jgi:exopolyphosphatase/guanosine-5'-triphosphate,3'-diphosphate pyrophosphatase|nr:HD domain-containing protein [Treponema sp.]
MESPGLYAVMEIGSTGIRLLVAETNGKNSGEPRLRILDESTRPVALGRDVFSSGAVSRESFLECLAVLQAYQEQLGGWGLDGGGIHIIATSAIRAARNRDTFTDRIRQETGLEVTVIEGIEENRLMYLALRFALKNDIPRFWRANSMILDVGGGSSEIMLLRRGKMVSSHSLRLGTILMDQKRRQGSAAFIERYLKENVRNTQDFLNDEMDLSAISTIAAAGSDVRQAAAHIGRELNEYCRVIGKDDFMGFVNSVEHFSVEECVRRYNIPYADAEGFVPGLLIYRTFLERTAAEELIVPNISVREGYLIDLVSGVDNELRNDFYSQITASAVNLGRKYRFDEEHSRHVARLCLSLFDALEKEHGMTRHERMMLETASLLHDIGMFIRSSGHHRHGQYIVANSEIFGLKKEELDIIGNVIRYHRDSPPSQADIEYLALQREERILVLKMASLLRVADALDRGHSQRIKNITVEKKTETLVIRTGESFDLSLEEIGMKDKSDLFEEVFGYKVILG